MNERTKDSDLLNKWLKRKETSPKKQLAKRPIASQAPLSFGQQQLWIIDQLHPNVTAHQYSEILILSGELDSHRLQVALNKVVDKHEILRTTYQVKETQPLQIIHDRNCNITLVDVSMHPLHQQEQVAREQILQRSQQTFDIATELPWRITLIKLNATRFYCLVTFHHILIDEWSVEIFWRDLAAAYTHRDRALAPLAIQYADFAYWQQTVPENQKELAYWKKQLNELQPTALPLDFKRPNNPTFEGKQEIKQMPPALLGQLKNLGEQQKVTLFTILVSTFNVLLAHYTDKTDISFGSPFTLRNKKVLEKLIGYLTNTLVWRTDVSGNPSFKKLLQRTQKVSQEAMTHSNLPFAKLVDALQIERTTNQNPLFNIMFVYKEIAKHPFDIPNTTVEMEVVDMEVATFDFTLFIREKDNVLDGLIEYNTQLFKAETIQQLLGDYIELLHRVVEAPNTPIQSLLSSAKAVESTMPSISWIHEEITKQAQENPHKIALNIQQHSLSYQQLNNRANLLASHLIAGGVETNTIVGLHLPRSVEMIIGILGILKAGAAYLPLDPHYPQERLEFMVADARIQHLITDSSLRGLLSDSKVTAYFTDQLNWKEEPLANIKFPTIKGTDLAYVIYTSGSSGQPKGVQINHDNLRYSTDARLQYYPKQPTSFLLMSSFSFDSSIAGIFWTLITGGKLVITEHRAEQDLRKLSQLIEKEEITHTLLLPSLYELLLQSVDHQALKTLTTVIVAGEACLPAVATLHYTTLEQTQLYNEYGPTEATVWSTVHHIPTNQAHLPIPIGKSIPHTTVYLLNEQLGEVPQGSIGEVYIAGPCLSVGYLYASEMTKQKFIKHPSTGERLYRTGDLGRYRADACIEFLGRADQQVKIRGHRIELNEVATRLRTLPLVKEVAVSLNNTLAVNHDEALIDALLQLAPEKAEELLQISESFQESTHLSLSIDTRKS